MTQTAVSSVLLVIVLVLLVIIFSCLYYLWDKTRKLEFLAIKSANSKPVHQTNGHICGYAGKELFDVLRDRKESPQLIEEMKKSYVFYLSRHLEAALEQGIIDRKKSRPSELECEIAVGGTRGEIISWLPMEVLSKFYVFGRGIDKISDDGNDDVLELESKLKALVADALSQLNMDAYAERMSDLISRKYLRDLSNRAEN